LRERRNAIRASIHPANRRPAVAKGAMLWRLGANYYHEDARDGLIG
jgi:hypothetical protein